MIVAGFGFSNRATIDSLRDALDRASQGTRPDALATAKDKAPTLGALAAELDLPLHGIAADMLCAQKTPTQSARVLAERETGSVAEAAALAAAGPGARLLTRRVHSTDRMATCSLAQGKIP